MRMHFIGRRSAALALAATLFAGFAGARGARAADLLTTKSPEVLAAIDRGIKYLESPAADDDQRVGAQALVGMAILTNNGKPDHPKVLKAAARVQKALAVRDVTKVNPDMDIYSTGMAIIFLIEHDPEGHRGDIEYLLSYLRAQQKKHGGWGYAGRDTGDTSMTQYGVLSSWEAKNHGFNVPLESIDAVGGWLLRTQDPSGAFGYQGNIAPNFPTLVAQSDVKHSMSAAGLGALYISTNILGIAGFEKPKEKDVPSALKEIKPKDAKPDPNKYKSKLDAKLVREAEARGNGWFAKNFKVQVDNYNMYYLYAFER